MARLDAELLEAHSLSLAEYEVLAILSESPDERLRMSELAARLHLSPSGLTRRLDGLVRRDLIRRERCPSDRRGAYAVLTKPGRRILVHAAPTHLRGVREHFVDRLTPRQLSSLGRSLQRIRAEL